MDTYNRSHKTIERYDLYDPERSVRVVFDLAVEYRMTAKEIIKASRSLGIQTINETLSIVWPSNVRKIRKLLEQKGKSMAVGNHTARPWMEDSRDNPNLRMDTRIRAVGAIPAWFKYCHRIDMKTGKIIGDLDDLIVIDPRFLNEVHGGPEWNVAFERKQGNIPVIDRYYDRVYLVDIDEVFENCMFPFSFSDEHPYVTFGGMSGRITGEYYTERIIPDDISNGRICIPGRYRSEARPMFPHIVSKVDVTLCGTTFNQCEWDPMGQVEGRVGAINIGSKLKDLVTAGDKLTVRLIEPGHYEIR